MPVSTNSAVPAASHKKKSNRKLFILLGVAALAIIALVVFAASRNKEGGIPVTTEKAVVKTITHLVTATGKVQPEVEVKISPEVAGELIEIPVVEGQAVKKGDLLVRIKPDFYQAQLEQQEAALASAKAASVLSQARLNKAEQDYKQAQELYAKQLVSDADFTSAKTNIDVARADFDSSLAQIRQTRALSARPAIRWPRPPSIRRWMAASAPRPARSASGWLAPAPLRAPRSCASPT